MDKETTMTRRYTLPYILILLLTLVWSGSIAQSRDVDEAFEQKGIAHKLWYGGGFTLGFSGTTNASVFQIGITPMVGYKLTDNLSVGPRIGITYQHIKGDSRDITTGELAIKSTGLTEYIAGVFARYKVFNQFFAHVEAEYRSSEFVLSDGTFLAADGDDLATVRQDEFQPIVGVGYNSSGGGPWGYEIMLLYRTNIPEDDIRSPFDLRIGFTYNF
jgi:hypothetical protein